MAIEIKAVQCPNCGSTDSTILKTDHYRCDSCGTEYFIDDGQPKPPPPTGNGAFLLQAKGVSTMGLFIGVSVFIIIVGIVLVAGFLPDTHYSGTAVRTIPVKPPVSWSYNYSYVFLSTSRRPIIIGTGTALKNDPPGQHAEPYAFFIDAFTDSLIEKMPIPGHDPSSSEAGWHFQQLSNGDLYAEWGGEQLYKIDKLSYSMTDVTQTFAADQPELQSGIAKVEFLPSGNQDGFHVVTNDGKQLYYFPFLHRVYKQQEFYLAETGMNTVLPTAKPATGYFFSAKRGDDGADSDRLIKLRYLDNGIGPKQQEFCEWQANGEPAPLKPNFERVLSRVNFTPGRLYFNPRFVFSDEDYVLISFSPTVTNGNSLLQCLDAHTAAIVFTARLDEGSPGAALRVNGGFAIYDGWVELVDMKGKIKKLKNNNQ